MNDAFHRIFVYVFRFHVKHIPFIGGSQHYFSIYTLKKRDILLGWSF
jgi:hypothetical protein